MSKILIVDDNEIQYKIMVKILEEAGYEVITANDGHLALTLARKYKPDLVITDLIMPGMEGVTLIAALKRDLPEIKIIAMSGGGELTTGGEYLESAEKLFELPTIVKPIESAQILKLVEKTLSE